MSEEPKRKLNQDDLAQVKSLIGEAKGDAFSLEEILAEYGSGKKTVPIATPVPPEQSQEATLSWPDPPHKPRKSSKVVSFPGAEPASTQEPETPPEESSSPEEPSGEEAPPEEEPEPSEGAAEPDSDGEPDPDPDSDQEPDLAEEDAGEETDEDLEDSGRIVAFPEEESFLASFLKKLTQKANRYADQMFEEDERTDPEQVRRLERLIPGTDQEEPRTQVRLRKFHVPKHLTPPPPDTPPQELAKTYAKGLKGLRVRSVLVAVLAIAALAQLLVPALGFVWLSPLDDMFLQRWIAVGLMGAGVLLGIDQIFTGLARAVRGKVGMDTLTALACLLTLGDGISLALQPDYPDRLPYTAAALAGLFFHLHGTYHKKCGLRLSCRMASASSTPYRVTLDEGKWNGRDTYAKWSGDSHGFGSQIQIDDGAQQLFQTVCPLLLVAAVVLSLLASVGVDKPEQLLWTLSALFTVSAAFGGGFIYGRPFHKVARRLSQCGAALAGWPGIMGSRRADRVLITDHDLFPPGYAQLNGYKVMRDFPTERVVAYTATLIRDSGSGLTKVFHDQLRALGGLMRHSENLCCYEGGGLSANIRGDQVLVGSAAFMNLMEIPLPQGLNVKSAVFCAINGELAGIFALNYTLPETVFPAMEELIEAKIGPVLATRDFNLIPAMLQQRFKLAADKMDFPPVERRRELSDPEQPHSETLTALLCREGLYPLAEVLTAAKRLRLATRLGALLCCVGSGLGLLLCTYLTSVSAYTSLSPLSLLVYLFSWFAPVWFLSGWVHRY
jgi:hypothetical protein